MACSILCLWRQQSARFLRNPTPRAVAVMEVKSRDLDSLNFGRRIGRNREDLVLAWEWGCGHQKYVLGQRNPPNAGGAANGATGDWRTSPTALVEGEELCHQYLWCGDDFFLLSGETRTWFSHCPCGVLWRTFAHDPHPSPLPEEQVPTGCSECFKTRDYERKLEDVSYIRQKNMYMPPSKHETRTASPYTSIPLLRSFPTSPQILSPISSPDCPYH
jgi:hypothetical protein